MTNMEIITGACVLNKVTDPVDTFAGWKRKGYKVKAGEKAVFKVPIWKPSKKKTVENETEDEEKKQQSRMYLVTAAFFTDKQVEKVEEQK